MTTEANPTPGGSDPKASGDGGNMVSYETYQKTVQAEKNAKTERDRLKAELDVKKQAELEAQGKHQELIESLRGQIKEKDENYKKTESTFYAVQVQNQLKTAAIKHGCEHPDKLLKLIDGKDYEKLQFNKTDMSVNGQDVEILMERLKKENDFLFKKSAAKFVDGNPGTQANVTDVSKLSTDDIKKRLKELSHKK